MKKVYSQYSSLGSSLVENCESTEDFTYVMMRLQFWRFIKDSGIHLCSDVGDHTCSLLHIDRIIGILYLFNPISRMLSKILLLYIHIKLGWLSEINDKFFIHFTATLREHDPALQSRGQEHVHLHKHNTVLWESIGLSQQIQLEQPESDIFHEPDIHDCYTPITFREFVIYLVTLAFFLYHRHLPV